MFVHVAFYNAGGSYLFDVHGFELSKIILSTRCVFIQNGKSIQIRVIVILLVELNRK